MLGSSSMFTFTSVSSFDRSSAMRSSTGETAWQGPHHSAQKSTITGFSLASTSWSKVDSVTAVDIEVPFCMGFGLRLSYPISRRSVIDVNAREPRVLPTLESIHDSHVPAAREGARSPRARARDSRAVGPRGHVRAGARAQSRRRALELHRRPDHRQQPDGRPSRLGPDAEGRVPAL